MGLFFIICYCHKFANKESKIRSIDLLSLVKEILKPWGGTSRICLTYRAVHCHNDADFEEYAQTYHEVLN